MVLKRDSAMFLHAIFASQVLYKNEETKEKNWIRDSIIQRIDISGPLTVADYMRIVLTSPTSGFYMKQDVFGSKGHFTTSPEISQIFGELVAVWLINEWQRFNASKPFRVIELGPGRGTLSMDISRVLSQFRHTHECASLHLVEISPYLTTVQEQTLCGHTTVRNKEFKGTHNSITTTGLPVTWYQTLDQVPNASGFSVFIAHEFLDALPIHKFQKNDKQEWREVLVNVDKNRELQFMLSNHPTPASKYFIPSKVEGNHFEVCPEAVVLTEKIIKRINENDGCFLICDYGYDGSAANRDTFRAFREHTLWNPLKEPGTADLTADVDFAALKSHVSDKATVFGTVTQQHFLQNLGIDLRLQ
ncbi:hypothetical protein B4U80_05483, partial [Leptotrombidium deliense]